MPDRTRPIRKEICLNEQELSMVRHKMNQLGTRNFGAYAQKMLIDGYIIKVDYTEQKKLAAAASNRIGRIDCKQSFRAVVVICPHYQSKRAKKGGTAAYSPRGPDRKPP